MNKIPVSIPILLYTHHLSISRAGRGEKIETFADFIVCFPVIFEAPDILFLYLKRAQKTSRNGLSASSQPAVPLLGIVSCFSQIKHPIHILLTDSWQNSEKNGTAMGCTSPSPCFYTYSPVSGIHFTAPATALCKPARRARHPAGTGPLRRSRTGRTFCTGRRRFSPPRPAP